MDKPFELSSISTWVDPADDGPISFMEIITQFRAFNQLIEWELHDYPFDSDEFYSHMTALPWSFSVGEALEEAFRRPRLSSDAELLSSEFETAGYHGLTVDRKFTDDLAEKTPLDPFERVTASAALADFLEEWADSALKTLVAHAKENKLEPEEENAGFGREVLEGLAAKAFDAMNSQFSAAWLEALPRLCPYLARYGRTSKND